MKKLDKFIKYFLFLLGINIFLAVIFFFIAPNEILLHIGKKYSVQLISFSKFWLLLATPLIQISFLIIQKSLINKKNYNEIKDALILALSSFLPLINLMILVVQPYYQSYSGELLPFNYAISLVVIFISIILILIFSFRYFLRKMLVS